MLLIGHLVLLHLRLGLLLQLLHLNLLELDEQGVQLVLQGWVHLQVVWLQQVLGLEHVVRVLELGLLLLLLGLGGALLITLDSIRVAIRIA